MIALLLGLLTTLCLANYPQCGTYQDKGTVHTVSDGTNDDRCFSLIKPDKVPRNGLPILFWFHGSGGNAKYCGSQAGGDDGIRMYDLAINGKYALVCGEALQSSHKGEWDIPEVINSTNNFCDPTVSIDVVYLTNVVRALSEMGGFDTSRIFTSGCSLGSAFSQFAATCLKKDGFGVSAMATHSTGLKTKGDGLRFPRCWHNSRYSWSECPECEYFPQRPEAWTDKLGLKACIFDNTGDGDFYKSSVTLASVWQELGNRAETHFAGGRHCQIHSYSDIVTCLDDGTGRLLSKQIDNGRLLNSTLN